MFSLLKKFTKHHTARRQGPRARLRVESLECRLVPYAVSGASWVHPELVTLSVVPDGTNLGGATSNLISTFNAKFGSQSVWLNQLAKAAQVWAQQTNLNFQIVADNGAASGSGNNQQGDPGFGDLRIGGFNFGTSSLAMSYIPPQANNYSLAGDMVFNTGQTWNIGSAYDVFTVAEHEIGHALGLLHSSVFGTVMWPTYTHAMSIQSDDIAGIRTMYSNGLPRSYDSNLGLNNSFLTAADVTPLLNPLTDTILVTGRDNTTTSQQEYYSVLVPPGTNGTMTVTVQSAGLSLLSPLVTVYDANHNALRTVGSSGQSATTLSVTVNGVSTGQLYYVRVKGADSSAFSTGAYGMTFQFSTYVPPAIPTPNTTTPNGDPLSGGGGIPFNPGNMGVETSRDQTDSAVSAAGQTLTSDQQSAVVTALADALAAARSGASIDVVNATLDKEINAVLVNVLAPADLASLDSTLNTTMDGAIQVSSPTGLTDAVATQRKNALDLAALAAAPAGSVSSSLGTSGTAPIAVSVDLAGEFDLDEPSFEHHPVPPGPHGHESALALFLNRQRHENDISISDRGSHLEQDGHQSRRSAHSFALPANHASASSESSQAIHHGGAAWRDANDAFFAAQDWSL